MAKFANILETVGHTPVIRINKLAPKGINLFVKIEAFNPLGSVKDRLALGVIEDAERPAELKPGQTVIEATSGNTGIGLAMVCAQKGYPLVVTMAETFSVERRRLMRFLGAKVVLTPAADRASAWSTRRSNSPRSMAGSSPASSRTRPTPTCIRARRPAKSSMISRASGSTTGSPDSEPVARSKVSRVCLPRSGRIQRSSSCEPAGCADAYQRLPKQERNPDGSPAERQSAWKPHPMQGWSPDFIPKLTGDAVDMGVIVAFVTIAGAGRDAMEPRTRAQRKASLSASRPAQHSPARCRSAEGAKAGDTVLCMLPDTGERYLSTPLFADIGVDMSENELNISNSTPNYRLPPKAA